MHASIHPTLYTSGRANQLPSPPATEKNKSTILFDNLSLQLVMVVVLPFIAPSALSPKTLPKGGGAARRP